MTAIYKATESDSKEFRAFVAIVEGLGDFSERIIDDETDPDSDVFKLSLEILRVRDKAQTVLFATLSAEDKAKIQAQDASYGSEW